MNDGHSYLKLGFGLMIFAFSLALAYFTASYLDTEGLFDYWSTLVIFGGAYVMIGIVVFQVYPVSLGFLFAADVLILHLMVENFGDIPEVIKTLLVGIILVLLYGFALSYMNDDQISAMDKGSTNPPQPPQNLPPTTSTPTQNTMN